MIEYDIVLAENNDDFIKKVNGRLAKGWKLVGAPFVVSATIYQAMIFKSSFNKIKMFFNVVVS